MGVSFANGNLSTNQSEMLAHATEDENRNGPASSFEAADIATSTWQPGAVTVLPSQDFAHGPTSTTQPADSDTPSLAAVHMQTAAASGSTPPQTIRVNPSMPEVIL